VLKIETFLFIHSVAIVPLACECIHSLLAISVGNGFQIFSFSFKCS